MVTPSSTGTVLSNDKRSKLREGIHAIPFRGLSGDTKPVNPLDMDTFYETDTGKEDSNGKQRLR